MKKQQTNQLVKYQALIILLVALMLGGCSRKATFMQSSVVPAAEGSVTVKKDNNQNYNIDIEINHLAEVEKVFTRRHVYIVWMETEEGDTKKLGQLISSKKFFSSQRKASLETVSTHKPVRVFVTAEKNQKTMYAEGKVILSTGNF